MERTELRKFQLAQLAILKRFDATCSELGLTYFLVFGTLLGAVRHQGFIPWDADIDVAMPRKDYETLRAYYCTHAQEELFYEHYDTERNHVSPHAELKIKGTHVVYKTETSARYQTDCDGIYIDIFPIDNAPDDPKAHQKQAKQIARVRRIVVLKAAPIYSSTSPLAALAKKAISILLTPFTFRHLWKKADAIMQRYNDSPTGRLAILTDPQVYLRQVFPRNCFETARRVPFEDVQLPIPAQAELFLQTRYGDFRKLPPEENRWTYVEDSLDHVDYGNTQLLKDLGG